MHLVYHALGVCIVNGWLLYRRHCHQNGTCIQYTMHLEYALLIDGCCIEDTATKWYMHLVYYALGVCIVNRWLLYRRLPSWYMHLVFHALGVCIVNRMVAVQKTLPSKWYMHLVYYALGVCIVNGWWLYRRHRQQNGTRIQYTTHLEYALLMDGGCIEDTASKMVHTFGILCTWSMHC